MMGIRINGPAFVYGDNQSVLANTLSPDLSLKKKSNSIAFHFVWEGTARDEWRTTYIETNENTSDILTKPLPSGEKTQKVWQEIVTSFVFCASGVDWQQRWTYEKREGSYQNHLFYFYIYFDTDVISDCLRKEIGR